MKLEQNCPYAHLLPKSDKIPMLSYFNVRRKAMHYYGVNVATLERTMNSSEYLHPSLVPLKLVVVERGVEKKLRISI